MTKPVVIIESPYACGHNPCCKPGTCTTLDAHIVYARAAMRDSILRGEVPLASHLLYTQPGVLDDGIPEERQLGIELGLAVRSFATKTVVYNNLGLTRGMQHGIDDAKQHGRPIEWRQLTPDQLQLTCSFCWTLPADVWFMAGPRDIKIRVFACTQCKPLDNVCYPQNDIFAAPGGSY